MLGNWECESNCEPCRVQGDFQPSRAISKAYVAAIENGTQDRERFATDQKGFGLAQWTYPQRKRNLWDAWKKSGQQIDSCEFQVSFAMWELQTEYPNLLKQLKREPLYSASEALEGACMRICREYERPAVNNVQVRYEAAVRISREIDLTGQIEVKPSQTEVNEPKLETWPPRVIDEHCSGWAEVWLLQSLLKCRGYNVLVDGIWGSVLTDKVKQFQTEHGLDADGCVGPMSWAKLMDRG
jgi:peptidoglycan hydrolase-like protein with peptidoglycan-binding domain